MYMYAVTNMFGTAETALVFASHRVVSSHIRHYFSILTVESHKISRHIRYFSAYEISKTYLQAFHNVWMYGS
jgi:hypothetical protein